MDECKKCLESKIMKFSSNTDPLAKFEDSELKPVFKYIFPIELISRANDRRHWAVQGKINKQIRANITLAMVSKCPDIELPCTVILTRISARKLDKDVNLPMCFKSVQDYVADFLIPEKQRRCVRKNKSGKLTRVNMSGYADGTPDITWIFDQKKGEKGFKGFSITIFQ